MTTSDFMDLVCEYAGYRAACQYAKSNRVFEKMESILNKVHLPD